jgi:putative nucleotidyltransferase with HDIG domain
MSLADWAEKTARAILADQLPRRWAHSQGVAARARLLAAVLGHDAEVLTAAAWLHDIGYAPEVIQTGCHQLDGARYLRDVEHAGQLLCRLVAHHSSAIIEAEERGLAGELSAEFRPPGAELNAALTYCDMTTSPHGRPMPVGQRLADIRARYGPGDPVSRAIARSAPQLAAAVAQVTSKLASYERPEHPEPGTEADMAAPADRSRRELLSQHPELAVLADVLAGGG